MSRFLLLSASMGAGHDAACAELSGRLRAAGHESAQLDVLSLLPDRPARACAASTI